MILAGLLRHGEVEGGSRFRGSTDDPLTSVGMQQMRDATKGECCWDQVITSPLQRCAVFANEYANQHQLPLSIEKRIAEIHFGSWEGYTAAELMKTQHAELTRFWNNPLDYTPPHAEPLTDFITRAHNAWHDMMLNYAGKRVLIVAHGGVIRVLLCYIQNYPIEKMLEIDVKHGALFTVNISGTDSHAIYTLIKQVNEPG
ncbi:MAG: alpha-ribazole phosphatase family protein [Methylococcales bacterium]